MAERPLNAYLPIQSTEVDGVVQPFAPRLSFGVGFEATFVEGTPNKIKIDITPSSVVDLIPDATNASDGLATAEQVTMLEDHETRLDDAEAALGVTRTGTVALADAQAWTDIGAVLPIAVSTTTFYELSLQAAWPDHTHASEVPDDADSVSAKVQVAVTRDGGTGITVEQRNGGSSWDLGRVLLRAADGGAGSWKLQVERADFAADTATTATVTATVRVLSSQAWSGETATSWVSLDGDGSLALGSGTPAAVAAVGSAGVSTDAAPFDHAHAIGPDVVMVNAGGNCTIAATTNGTTEQSLDVTCDNFGLVATGDCAVTSATDFSVTAPSINLLATTHTCKDASGNYACTTTPAAAFVESYQNTVTSVTSRIAQAASGAGKSRFILGGLGASGSANGVFVSGLENGNTVLGGEHWLACGSLVANVSDKVRFGTGTPGAMTSFLDVYQSASGTVTIDPRSNSISFPSHPTHQILTSAYALLRGPEMYHDVDTIHRRTTATTQIADSKCGTFGPIASATTTTVFSHTTTTARIYDVRATVVVTNDTDNEGAAYYLRASFKNIAGTVTQIGATQAIAADLEDAGQTGLSCTIDFSGTAIRVRLTTDATDTVNGSYVVDITERVQA